MEPLNIPLPADDSTANVPPQSPVLEILSENMSEQSISPSEGYFSDIEFSPEYVPFCRTPEEISEEIKLFNFILPLLHYTGNYIEGALDDCERKPLLATTRDFDQLLRKIQGIEHDHCYVSSELDEKGGETSSDIENRDPNKEERYSYMKQKGIAVRRPIRRTISRGKYMRTDIIPEDQENPAVVATSETDGHNSRVEVDEPLRLRRPRTRTVWNNQASPKFLEDVPKEEKVGMKASIISSSRLDEEESARERRPRTRAHLRNQSSQISVVDEPIEKPKHRRNISREGKEDAKRQITGKRSYSFSEQEKMHPQERSNGSASTNEEAPHFSRVLLGELFNGDDETTDYDDDSPPLVEPKQESAVAEEQPRRKRIAGRKRKVKKRKVGDQKELSHVSGSGISDDDPEERARIKKNEKEQRRRQNMADRFNDLRKALANIDKRNGTKMKSWKLPRKNWSLQPRNSVDNGNVWRNKKEKIRRLGLKGLFKDLKLHFSEFKRVKVANVKILERTTEEVIRLDEECKELVHLKHQQNEKNEYLKKRYEELIRQQELMNVTKTTQLDFITNFF